MTCFSGFDQTGHSDNPSQKQLVILGEDKPAKFQNLKPKSNRILKGGVVIPLIFPKVPQSSLGIVRVPQLPPSLEHPPLKNPIKVLKL